MSKSWGKFRGHPFLTNVFFADEEIWITSYVLLTLVICSLSALKFCWYNVGSFNSNFQARLPNLIGGDFVDSSAKDWIDVINPVSLIFLIKEEV